MRSRDADMVMAGLAAVVLACACVIVAMRSTQGATLGEQLAYLTTPLAAGECLTGPGNSAAGFCSGGDRDHDGDVDLRDFALATAQWSGGAQ